MENDGCNPEYVGKRMSEDKMDANTDMMEKDGCRDGISGKIMDADLEYT